MPGPDENMHRPREESTPERAPARFDPALIEAVREQVGVLLTDADIAAFERQLAEERKQPFSDPYPHADEFTRLLAGAMRMGAPGDRVRRTMKNNDFIRRNVDRVLDGLDDPARRNLSISALAKMLDESENCSPEEIFLVTSALEPYAEEMVADFGLHSALSCALHWKGKGKVDMAKRCIAVAMVHVKPDGVEQCPATVYACVLCKNPNLEIQTAAREMFFPAIPDGFDKKVLLDAWVACPKSSLGESSIFQNIRTIADLEARHEGAALTLCQEFGIRCFARYDIDQLLEQYSERDDLRKKYGVVVFPLDDHNGAFHDVHAKLGDANEDLKSLGRGMRIVEAGSPTEMRRRLMGLYRKYAGGASGNGPKFSFVLIAGHGNPSGIRLGKMGVITERSLHDTSARALRTACEEGAEISLISCSTGVEGGIAHKASETLLSTTGPQSDTNISRIDVLPADTPAGVVLVPQYNSYDGKRHAAKG